MGCRLFEFLLNDRFGHFDFAQCDKNVLGGISGLSVVGCPLWVVGFLLWVVGCPLWIV